MEAKEIDVDEIEKKSRRKRQSSNVQRIASGKSSPRTSTKKITTTTTTTTSRPSNEGLKIPARPEGIDPNVYQFIYQNSQSIVKSVLGGLEIEVKLAGLPGTIK